MANEEDKLVMLQEIANRKEQARLNDDQLVMFNVLVDRGDITLPDTAEEDAMDSFQFFERTLGQQIVGTGEMLATIVTGALIEPVAGFQGIVEGVAAFVAGDDDPLLRASEAVQKQRRGGTFIPKTRAGEESLMAVSRPIEFLFNNVIQPGAQFVGDATGSPLAATAVQTFAETFPPGLRPKRVQTALRKEGGARLAQLERNTGVELDNPLFLQTQQIADRAKALSANQVNAAQNFDSIQTALVDARDIAKENTNQLYKIARETKASVPNEFITILNDSIAEVLTDTDIRDFQGKVMKNRVNLNNRVQELDALVMQNPLTRKPDVMLNELSGFRQRLNNNKGVDASERLALGKVKGILDSFMDDMFDADVMSGDPAAIQKWKDATKAFSDYRTTFSDNKVIKKLTQQEANGEMVKSWVMGANAVGAKKEAGMVIDSIGDIIGRNSPEFASIRQEVLFDVMQPLLSVEPNLKAFVHNYDRFIRNNKSLTDSVFPDSIPALKDLRDIAEAADSVFTTRFQLNFTKTMARAFFGHDLAKGQVKINLATQAIGFIMSSGTTRQRQISAHILGYNTRTPVMKIGSIPRIGLLQALGEPANQDPNQDLIGGQR